MQTAPKRVINGWAMYDWANSVYNLVITTTFFPIYFTGATKKHFGSDNIPFLGRTFVNSSLYDYTLAAAYLLVALSYPILTSIADTRGNKKDFMRVFCYLGALGCSLIYFFNGANLWLGVLAFMMASMGYVGSLVFYNAYLPEIAAPEDRDRISAKGYSYGYIGSVLMQIIGFVLVILLQDDPGFLGPRITFFLVGLWWIGFAQITFARLPKTTPVQTKKVNIFTDGFKEVKKVYSEVKKMPVLKRFLRGFFFYSMGVQTVMLAATLFGSKTLELPASILIVAILIIQIVAILGAWLMSKLSARFGNLSVLAVVILIWIGICIGAYFTEARNPLQFYILGGSVGLVMGGIQSLSRSTYAKLMPETKDTASFFSFYDVTEKLAIVIGMTSFGFIEEITGNNMRNSVLALGAYFIIAFVLMLFAIGKLRQTKQAVN